MNDKRKNELHPHKSVILQFKMTGLKQNLLSITTVIGFWVTFIFDDGNQNLSRLSGASQI